MHRTIEVTVPPSCTNELIGQLEQEEHVINLSVVRGASIKPPGDVLTVHALNRGANQVMRLAEGAHGSPVFGNNPSVPHSPRVGINHQPWLKERKLQVKSL